MCGGLFCFTAKSFLIKIFLFLLLCKSSSSSSRKSEKRVAATKQSIFILLNTSLITAPIFCAVNFILLFIFVDIFFFWLSLFWILQSLWDRYSYSWHFGFRVEITLITIAMDRHKQCRKDADQMNWSDLARYDTLCFPREMTES